MIAGLTGVSRLMLLLMEGMRDRDKKLERRYIHTPKCI
jgi:hypothetical protein